MTRLRAVTVGGDPDIWRLLGLSEENGLFHFSDVDVRTVDRADVDVRTVDRLHGLPGWTLTSDRPGVPGPAAVDGIPTSWVSDSTSTLPRTPILGGTLIALDHVVIMSDDLERTCTAVETATGAPLKRVREAGGGVRQGFHRLDNTILEVVCGPTSGPGTRLWGVVGVVDEIDAVAEALVARLGAGAVSTPRGAVQPGRRICTIRLGDGLGVALALMTPEM